jgi:hypothetical protein
MSILVSACRLVLLLALLLLGRGLQAAENDTWAYRIEPGDTLIGIRDRLLVPGADWRPLQRLNRIRDPRRLVPGSTLQIPLALLRQQPVQAEVLHLHGEVSVQRGGAPPQPLRAGDTLSQGDLVRTGRQSSTTLRLADGARLLLRPDSMLRLERSVRLGDSPAVDSRVRLDSGSVDTQVPRQPAPRFEIRTPVANLGVRGTEFRTRATPAETAVEVIAGRVAAAGGAAPQVIDAGFGALATAQGTSPPRVLPAAPDLTPLPPRIDRLPLVLPWVAAAGTTNYRAQVFDAARPELLLLDGLFTGASARWIEDLPDGPYLLQVRAIDVGGLEGLDAVRPFTLKARPEPPFVTRPRAGARTGDEDIGFAWTRAAGTARYRLQVADTPDFAQPRVDRDDITTSEVSLALPVGTHHWRLASIRADGDAGPWGDALTVTRVALPPAPSSEPPRPGADGVLLQWRASEGASYQVQVSGDAGFSALLHDERVAVAEWLLRKPAPGAYFVRVRAVDAEGFVGPWGATQQVDVPRSLEWLWLLAPLLLLLL